MFSVTKDMKTDGKHIMRTLLIDQGRDLFSQYGLQKTSIHDITKGVGIAQGTFYNYFSSKEELYFVILEKEEENIREQLLNDAINKHDNPKKVLKQFLTHLVDTVETNPFIRELFFGENLKIMVRKLPPEILEKHFEKESDAFIPLIEKWKMEGIILKENAETIAGLFRSLFLLTFHQKEIGNTVYDYVMERLCDYIVDGILE